MADLTAQVAACETGARALARMVGHYGIDVVRAYMGHVQDNAEELVRQVLDTLAGGEFAYPMDNGAEIRVRVDVDREARRATIDFTGTSPRQPDNFNAPTAVCKAAVLYVFRSLIDDDIPLNAGCLEPLDIVVPEDSMLAPEYPAAVVAGNVETSQYVTDTLFGALGVMAASQGTMNNVTFGDDALAVLRDQCRRRRGGPRFRRRLGGPDPHDQRAAGGPGGARMAVPGPSSNVCVSARGRAAAAATSAGTDPTGDCGSCGT